MLSDNVQPHLPQTWGFCDSAKILKRKLEDSQSRWFYRLPSIHTQELSSFTITVSLQRGKNIFTPRRERSYSSREGEKKGQSYWKWINSAYGKLPSCFSHFYTSWWKRWHAALERQMKHLLIPTGSTQCWIFPRLPPPTPVLGCPACSIYWQTGRILWDRGREFWPGPGSSLLSKPLTSPLSFLKGHGIPGLPKFPASSLPCLTT